MGKIKQKKRVCLIVLACVLMLVFAGIGVQAAVYNYENTSVELVGTKVGRYRLNYTGSTNFYDVWNTDGIKEVSLTYNDAGSSYSNSSTAVLSAQSSSSTIVYAYLIWEARGSEFEGANCKAATTPVALITPGGGKYTISPIYAISDARNLGGSGRNYGHYYTLAADVTDIVKSAGFGSYSVANIFRWDPSYTYKDSAGEYPGGDSVGAWQLVIVEESDDFTVRAVSFSIASEFHMGTDFAGQVTLGNGLKSKSAGTAGGQFLFAALRSQQGKGMTEQIVTKNSSGIQIKTAYGSSTTQPGLYKNGTCFNTRDQGRGGICVDLSDVSDIGNSAVTADLSVENSEWTTFNMLGISFDIAYPDFSGTQKTTVNSSTSVTVSGTFTNTASTANTGIYNGNMVVTLDDALTPTSATATVNGTTTISGTISGHTVTFSGSAVSSMMNGNSISYTVQCTANNSGKTKFENTAGFSGYLRSDGTNTGYWIDRMWMASSTGVPKYTVTLNAGTGIASVTGAGEYSVGSKVIVGAELAPGYHWKGWSGSYSTAQQGYTFTMPAANLNMTASGEANTYTIQFDPNDGGELAAVSDITVSYDGTLTLPDASGAYVKYTLDGVNVTQEVLDGTYTYVSTEAEETEETEPEDAEPEDAEAEETETEDAETEETEPEDAETEEEPEAEEAERTPRVYESVFMGWSLEDGRDSFTPQWTAGTGLDVSTLVNAAGAAKQNGAVITLYAVWDDCPWIQATDRYYTLEQAQSGYITEEELLSHATASDREDGSPIEAGFHEDGTSFSIPDFQAEDFTCFEADGSCTENLTVVDSVGSVYVKQITVYVVDTTPVEVMPEGTTRFINEYYYYQPYEKGGLEDNSIWKTDPDYVAALEETFENVRNDTPIAVYTFSHEEILLMKEFIAQHGVGNSEEGALTEFYNRFMAPNKVE